MTKEDKTIKDMKEVLNKLDEQTTWKTYARALLWLIFLHLMYKDTKMVVP